MTPIPAATRPAIPSPDTSPATTTNRPTPWHHARPGHTNAALAVLGLILFLLSRHLIAEYDNFTIGFSGTSGWSVWVYLAAVLVILLGPVDRLTFPIILTVAIACRLATLYADPVLSSDVYRYVWDGVVQHAGINPYRYVPGNPALTFLRDPNIDVFNSMNRRDYAHTIYPPFAQILFNFLTFISPTMTFMKTAMVLFEGLTLWALIQILHHLGIRREQTLIYAWCPLLIWEIAGSGHLDSAAMALFTLAILFRYRQRPILTGLFLALAVLTKMYPLALFPALYNRHPIRRTVDPTTGHTIITILPGLEWKMPAVMLTLAVALYALYSSVGMGVFGFLGGYVQEEGMQTGTRYFLLEQLQHLPGLGNLPTSLYYAICVLILGILSIWALRTSSPLPGLQPSPLPEPAGTIANRITNTIPADIPAATATESLAQQLRPHHPAAFLCPATVLPFVLMLLFSPHYPWYVAWLIPSMALLPNFPVFAYVLGLFYLCYTALAAGYGPKQFLLNQRLYTGVLIATLLYLALRRWPRHLQLRPATRA